MQKPLTLGGIGLDNIDAAYLTVACWDPCRPPIPDTSVLPCRYLTWLSRLHSAEKHAFWVGGMATPHSLLHRHFDCGGPSSVALEWSYQKALWSFYHNDGWRGARESCPLFPSLLISRKTNFFSALWQDAYKVKQNMFLVCQGLISQLMK